MIQDLLVGAIEGRLIYLNEEATLEVNDDKADTEYINSWLEANLPEAGHYVRIEVMVFPREGVK